MKNPYYFKFSIKKIIILELPKNDKVHTFVMIFMDIKIFDDIIGKYMNLLVMEDDYNMFFPQNEEEIKKITNDVVNNYIPYYQEGKFSEEKFNNFLEAVLNEKK